MLWGPGATHSINWEAVVKLASLIMVSISGILGYNVSAVSYQSTTCEALLPKISSDRNGKIIVIRKQ